MSEMYRTPFPESEELLVLLYGSQRDWNCVREEDDGSSEEEELDSESGKEGRCSSLSLEVYGLQRERRTRPVYFSNREYYRRMEELKRTHLRNMADLEMMYIDHGVGSHGEEEDGGLGRGKSGEAREPISPAGKDVGFMPARRLQRINSQEELDFHETSSSGSEQSELCGEDSVGEPEPDCPTRTAAEDRTFDRVTLLNPGATTARRFWFRPEAPCPKPQGTPSRPAGVGVRSGSKVTIPQPFQMMLREEERKRRRVRTRSEVELENSLLRRELEELRECCKTFRASPAPAHVRLPLYEVIRRGNPDRGNEGNRDTDGNRAPFAASPQPFSFLERERRKREAKVTAALGNLDQKEERWVFKARPVPSSVYGPRRRSDTESASRRRRSLTLSSLEREATEGLSDTDLETDGCRSKSDMTAYDSSSWVPQMRLSAKPGKKQIGTMCDCIYTLCAV